MYFPTIYMLLVSVKVPHAVSRRNTCLATPRDWSKTLVDLRPIYQFETFRDLFFVKLKIHLPALVFLFNFTF